ncbi:hypothetical protein [uncultured Endozoicomonas sp.]|uniref:hypothetical protein n=1 Tax=uncultured Endozoicomonas sp. TaxID=432652 RepID=UPI00260DF3AA|nr:hypothetical protein [uncultured Endozoicomonas sp.]
MNDAVFKNSSIGFKDKVFLLTFLFGIYIDFDYKLTEYIPIPAVFAGFAALSWVLFSKIFLHKKVISFIIYFTLLSLITVFFGYDPNNYYLADRINSLLILIYSISLGYIAFCMLLTSNKVFLESVFFKIVVVLLFGSFLEVATPFKQIVTLFKESLYYEHYLAFERDIEFFGIVRPTFFSSEPSHLAIFFMFCLLNWWLLTENKKKNLIYMVSLLASLLVIRSPVLIGGFIFLAFNFIFFELKKLNAYQKPLAILILPAFFLISLYFLSDFFAARLDAMFSLRDASFVIRIVVPPMLTYEVITASPLFGVGIGGKEVLFSEIINLYDYFDVPPVIYVGRLGQQFNNLFWEYIQYYGLLGGSIGLYLFRRLFFALSLESFILYIFFIMLLWSQFFGAINGVRFWSFFFILTAVLIHRNNFLTLPSEK